MEPRTNFPQPQFTDEQWSLIVDLFPAPAPDPRGGRPRGAAVPRRLCRRHVRLGEKGGDLVGPTNRVKGTKLLILIEGAG
jgi:hypothetical protein